MKLVIHGVGLSSQPGSLRRWQPGNPDVVIEMIDVEIGHKGGKRQGADQFYLRVATPAGLDTLEPEDGILVAGPMLVMKRYGFDDLWRWLEQTVAKCEADTWTGCVEKLRAHFRWEYEGYKES